MAQGNQVIKITGSFGGSVVVDITYNKNTNTLTITREDGTSYDIQLEDKYVDAVSMNGTVLELQRTDGAKMSVDIGSIAIENGGKAWSATKSYVIGDVVSYGDNLYIAKIDNQNVQPVKGGNSAWFIVDVSYSVKLGKEYDPTKTYDRGDIVSFGPNKAYIALSSTGNGPFDPSNWIRIDRGGSEWNAVDNYVIGDVVSKGDKIYIATTNNSNMDPAVNTADWTEISGSGGGSIDFATQAEADAGIIDDKAISPKTMHKKIEADDYGTSTVGGTAKFHLDVATQTLYITTDGTDAG